MMGLLLQGVQLILEPGHGLFAFDIVRFGGRQGLFPRIERLAERFSLRLGFLKPLFGGGNQIGNLPPPVRPPPRLAHQVVELDLDAFILGLRGAQRVPPAAPREQFPRCVS